MTEKQQTIKVAFDILLEYYANGRNATQEKVILALKEEAELQFSYRVVDHQDWVLSKQEMDELIIKREQEEQELVKTIKKTHGR